MPRTRFGASRRVLTRSQMICVSVLFPLFVVADFDRQPARFSPRERAVLAQPGSRWRDRSGCGRLPCPGRSSRKLSIASSSLCAVFRSSTRLDRQTRLRCRLARVGRAGSARAAFVFAAVEVVKHPVGRRAHETAMTVAKRDARTWRLAGSRSLISWPALVSAWRRARSWSTMCHPALLPRRWR